MMKFICSCKEHEFDVGYTDDGEILKCSKCFKSYEVIVEMDEHNHAEIDLIERN